jgi:predicted small lipoprotein YifL
MKKSIFALMIAATALLASCGSKTTEEVTSEEVETAVEETPVEEVPQLEEIEEVVEDSTETSGN